MPRNKAKGRAKKTTSCPLMHSLHISQCQRSGLACVQEKQSSLERCNSRFDSGQKSTGSSEVSWFCSLGRVPPSLPWAAINLPARWKFCLTLGILETEEADFYICGSSFFRNHHPMTSAASKEASIFKPLAWAQICCCCLLLLLRNNNPISKKPRPKFSGLSLNEIGKCFLLFRYNLS